VQAVRQCPAWRTPEQALSPIGLWASPATRVTSLCIAIPGAALMYEAVDCNLLQSQLEKQLSLRFPYLRKVSLCW
jgi:hypothetical protein